MTISELIEKLEAIRDKEGDLDVRYARDYESYEDTIEEDLDDSLLNVKEVHAVREYDGSIRYADHGFFVNEHHVDGNGFLCTRTVGGEPGAIRRRLAIGYETDVHCDYALDYGKYSLDID